MRWLSVVLPSLLTAALLPVRAYPASQSDDYVRQAQNPFDENGDNLPDLGLAPETNAAEKHLARMAKAFGEASQTDSALSPGQQARHFAFTRLRDAVSDTITSEAESLLSPYGSATVDLLVDEEGNFNGSSGSLFTPWQDNDRYLTWSQVGVSQQNDGLVGNAGIGQRWAAGHWRLGYNTFYDRLFDDDASRAGFGAERGATPCVSPPTTINH